MKQTLSKKAFIITILISFLTSCSKFLDEKPDKKLSTPNTLRDLQLLLDNEGVFNNDYPSGGDIASDFFYLSSNDVASIPDIPRDNYLWNESFDFLNNWSSPYQKVYHANVVLDCLSDVRNDDPQLYNSIKGSALFYRAFSFFKIAQHFAPPYQKENAKNIPGIPIITSSDINSENKRANLEDTYRQIISDLKSAIPLLPNLALIKTRPCKAAAYSLLAYTYLIIHDFENANSYSDSSLAITDELLNYNQIITPSNPFERFNTEVLFQARIIGGLPLAPARCKVDTILYSMYAANDIRRSLFYKENSDGSYAFKGSYDGNPNGSNLFGGITIDETYLLKAESSARLGNTSEAMHWLNKLLRTRFEEGTFVEFTAENATHALQTILGERRKELAFRGGIRWTDLRRLNLEPSHATTIRRNVNGQEYALSPGDLRYTFLIPTSVIQISGIQQNPR